MSLSTPDSASPAADVATFAAFFDDAAIFPPGLAPLDTAVNDHLRRRQAPLAELSGPLILTPTELPRAQELAAASGVGGQLPPVRVSVVAAAAALTQTLEAIRASKPTLTVDTLELKTSAEPELYRNEISAAGEVGDATVYVELTAQQVASGGIEQIAGSKLRLKFRTGGIRAELFPSVAELAQVIHHAVALNIPFKLTAGLHRATRYTDGATGFTHHGFLNIALATAQARSGATANELEGTLRQVDGPQLARDFAQHDPSWRKSFVSFGTCSMAEPLKTLEALGFTFDPTTPSSTPKETDKL